MYQYYLLTLKIIRASKIIFIRKTAYENTSTD